MSNTPAPTHPDSIDPGTAESDKGGDRQPSSTEADAETRSCDEKTKTPREIGGRDGPDPTRYGDWEKNGRCIDF